MVSKTPVADYLSSLTGVGHLPLWLEPAGQMDVGPLQFETFWAERIDRAAMHDLADLYADGYDVFRIEARESRLLLWIGVFDSNNVTLWRTDRGNHDPSSF